MSAPKHLPKECGTNHYLQEVTCYNICIFGKIIVSEGHGTENSILYTILYHSIRYRIFHMIFADIAIEIVVSIFYNNSIFCLY